MDVRDGELRFVNSSFIRNYAGDGGDIQGAGAALAPGGKGGAIHVDSAAPRISLSEFVKNVAGLGEPDGRGGAIYGGSDVFFENCSFAGNIPEDTFP